ncbi:GGDEF domain-containing protein [Aliiroseovarius sp. S253]|uniref:GGDEF domain-containing protein n=1 Tax=Aliiroseovarius sp. S253 TaxID=3415133 RepID=UPI003C7B55D6
MRITDRDIASRKRLLGLTSDLESLLGKYDSAAKEFSRKVVDDFYLQQTAIPQIQNIIGDSDTLKRLKNAMAGYVESLFRGQYGAGYVNSRLRIGKVHAQIGVPPKLYVSSMHRLEGKIEEVLVREHGYDMSSDALKKLMLFDLQLVFDTYIQGLVSEVKLARDEVISYSETLEQMVAERTAEVERLASRDDLTGLLNRRKFMEDAEAMLEEARSSAGCLSLVFMDINSFKSVNDQIGHHAGDMVLSEVGAAIRSQLKDGDLAARYGGDEFCILLHGVEQNSARDFCRRLSETLPVTEIGRIVGSYGTATAQDGHWPQLDALIAQADRSMYESRAERAGPRGNVIPVVNLTEVNDVS